MISGPGVWVAAGQVGEPKYVSILGGPLDAATPKRHTDLDGGGERKPRKPRKPRFTWLDEEYCDRLCSLSAAVTGGNVYVTDRLAVILSLAPLDVFAYAEQNAYLRVTVELGRMGVQDPDARVLDASLACWPFDAQSLTIALCEGNAAPRVEPLSLSRCGGGVRCCVLGGGRPGADPLGLPQGDPPRCADRSRAGGPLVNRGSTLGAVSPDVEPVRCARASFFGAGATGFAGVVPLCTVCTRQKGTLCGWRAPRDVLPDGSRGVVEAAATYLVADRALSVMPPAAGVKAAAARTLWRAASRAYRAPARAAALGPVDGLRRFKAVHPLALVGADFHRTSARACLRGAVVVVERTPRGLRVVGGRRCGSAWRCPLCAKAAVQVRAGVLASAFSQYVYSGAVHWTGLLTMPHRWYDGLAEQLDTVREFVASLRYDRQPSVWSYSVETRYGYHGWHTHVHTLMAGDGCAAWWATVVQRWIARTGANPDFCRLQPVGAMGSIEAYLAKGSLMEWTGAGHDKAGGSLSPLELLAGAHAGEPRCLAAWREYEAATERRKAFWVRGARVDLRDAPASSTLTGEVARGSWGELVADARVLAAFELDTLHRGGR